MALLKYNTNMTELAHLFPKTFECKRQSNNMEGFVYLLTNIAGLCVYLPFIARHTVLFHTTRIIEE